MIDGPKIVTWDIETFPNLVWVWGLRNQFISLNQIVQRSRAASFAAKTYGNKTVEFFSEFHDGREEFLRQAHRVFDEADILVSYNGKRFDTPKMKREWLKLGLPPASPVLEVDLFQTVKKNFSFDSMKLENVATELGIGHKVAHEGFGLWIRCMEGDESAWKRMKTYNIGDVKLTEKLYDRMLPWITDHPHIGLWVEDENCCPNCGKDSLQRRGYSFTGVSKFQRYACMNPSCGRWSRGKEALFRIDARGDIKQ